MNKNGWAQVVTGRQNYPKCALALVNVTLLNVNTTVGFTGTFVGARFLFNSSKYGTPLVTKVGNTWTHTFMDGGQPMYTVAVTDPGNLNAGDSLIFSISATDRPSKDDMTYDHHIDNMGVL